MADNSLGSQNSQVEGLETASSGRGVALLMTVIVLVGVVAGLLWMNSRTDTDADLAAEEISDGEPVEQDSEEEPPTTEGASEPAEEDEPAPAESTVEIPSWSSATVSVEPTLVSSPFNTLFGDAVLSTDGTGAPSQPAPPVIRLVDGGTWEPIATEAFVDGEANTVEYIWGDIRQLGNGLAVTAVDPDRLETEFVSTDGEVWVQRPEAKIGPDEYWLFDAVSVSDEDIVALTVNPWDQLAEFANDHTAATDVENVCMARAGSAVSCDESDEESLSGQWSFTAETIDSSAGSEAVLSCLSMFETFGANFELARVDLADSAARTSSLRVFPQPYSVDDMQALDDGRIAGMDILLRPDELTCDGLADFDYNEQEPFYVFDPADGSVERAAITPAERSQDFAFLGPTLVGGTELFIFTIRGDLYALDLASDEWTLLAELPSSNPFVLDNSGRRLFSFAGTNRADLDIIDLVVGESGELETLASAVFVPLPDNVGLLRISEVSFDRVLYQAGGEDWVIDIPAGR